MLWLINTIVTVSATELFQPRVVSPREGVSTDSWKTRSLGERADCEGPVLNTFPVMFLCK